MSIKALHSSDLPNSFESCSANILLCKSLQKISNVKKVLRPLPIIMSSVGSFVSSLFLLYPLEGLSFQKKWLFCSLFMSYLAQKAHIYFSSDTCHDNKLEKFPRVKRNQNNRRTERLGTHCFDLAGKGCCGEIVSCISYGSSRELSGGAIWLPKRTGPTWPPEVHGPLLGCFTFTHPLHMPRTQPH